MNSVSVPDLTVMGWWHTTETLKTGMRTTGIFTTKFGDD